MVERTASRIFIAHDEIIPEAPRAIRTLDELGRFVEERSLLFFSRLATVTRNARGKLGRENLTVSNGYLDKAHPPTKDGDIFTGSMLCEFASRALAYGLEERVKEIDLKAVRLETDLVAEEWDNPDHVIIDYFHDIVRATDLRTGERLYFDPTYRQIDHRFQGTILSFGDEEADRYYKNRRGEIQIKLPPQVFPFDGPEAKALRLTREDYMRLVASV